MRERKRAAQVVRFWRALEMFDPQPLPRATRHSPRRAEEYVVDLAPDEPAPWEPGHPISRIPLPAGRAWTFTVYGGLYPLAAIRDAMEAAFGRDPRYRDGRAHGESALFSFTLNAEGYLVENSATLSSCGWACGRLRAPGPDAGWLDGFDEEARAFTEGFNGLARRMGPRPEASAGPATGNTAGNTVGPLDRAGRAAAGRAKSAAVGAAGAGAKAAGAAVTGVVAAAVGSVAGPLVGGVVGPIVGTFVEKLLTPGKRADPKAEVPAAGAEGGLGPPGFARRPVPAGLLHEFVGQLADALGAAATLGAAGVRVRCVPGPAFESDFLNSSIADDLARVEEAVRGGAYGRGLAEYLTDERDIPKAERRDVVRDVPTAVHGVAPRFIPPGRWPAEPTRSLVLSQQFAVNQALAGADGVFAVNGPPGTGKTTMLRDVVAAVVVRRATRLLELDPADAFTVELDRVSLSKQYHPRVYGLAPALTGHEVLLATSSNDAAANVTTEIPGLGAVEGRQAQALAADYFPELASLILDGEAWGLVAAKLGRREFRREFAQRFWWGAPRDGHQVPGMRMLLERARDEPESAPDWDSAKSEFTSALEQVRTLARQRQRAAESVAALPEARMRAERAIGQLEEATLECRRLLARAEHGAGLMARAAEIAEIAEADYQRHRRAWPGFWTNLRSGFRARRDWAEADEPLLRVYRQHVGEHRELASRAARERELVRRAEQARQMCQQRQDAEAATVRELTRWVDDARARWPSLVPPEAPDGTAELQLTALWADQEYTEARSRLFLEALRLHKAFVLRAGRKLRDNLAVLAGVLGDDLPVAPEALLAAWQTLFLVVPVVSTTFASLPRLFGALGRESFGWLLVDEAGQATPQQAVGGIWRARRTVLVGDPKQLEPIVTLPAPAREVLRRGCAVHEQWAAEDTSAQQVADRVARFGTLLPAPGEWVGAPLRVHRRCDRPLFEISNAIAYGGSLLVFGTGRRAAFPGGNGWIDVRSAGDARGNWVPAEGVALSRLLRGLVDEQGLAPDTIRVLSPFRDVVREARLLTRDGVRVGTVHTVQGQEADVVVLVLGGAPGRAGVRRFATEKPNLLNVAVSRARRRLYAIGDRGSWGRERHFDHLAAALGGPLEHTP